MSELDNRAQAREVMVDFVAQMAAWRPGRSSVPRVELLRLPPVVLAVLDEVMGEGEVGIRIAGAREVRIQETVFAGVWRLREFDAQGRLIADGIEGGAIPAVVPRSAQAGARTALDMPEFPAGVMNAPALLHEIGAQMAACRPGARAHVVNLTLLPLTPADHAALAQAFPPGPVAMVTRGFGNCRIASTTARNVWRVQYHNNLQALILDTIEIVDVPEVALAASEDLADSRERLGELLAWLGDPVEA